MALSNLRREPRREITETVIGLAVFAVFLWGDYHAALWFEEATTGSKAGACPWPVGMFVGLLLTTLSIFLSFPLMWLIHAMGETVCDILQGVGIHLRPRVRR